jgi:hypothetical protein
LYVFRDCPNRVVVMFARDEVGQPALAAPALKEILMRMERRRVRNGWPDREAT